MTSRTIRRGLHYRDVNGRKHEHFDSPEADSLSKPLLGRNDYEDKPSEVDVVVTTAGGVEDLIKCIAPTYKGDFSLAGAALRSKGLNRIGNLLVPNGNYCKFEYWIIPIFDQMLEEQTSKGVLWTPSKLIARLGKEINHESSYLYWAYKVILKPDPGSSQDL